MSMFLCHECDNLRDADDGCEEGSNNSLICVTCMYEIEDERRQMINVGGHKDGGSAS